MSIVKLLIRLKSSLIYCCYDPKVAVAAACD
jgi:hypothetical protein